MYSLSELTLTGTPSDPRQKASNPHDLVFGLADLLRSNRQWGAFALQGGTTLHSPSVLIRVLLTQASGPVTRRQRRCTQTRHPLASFQVAAVMWAKMQCMHIGLSPIVHLLWFVFFFVFFKSLNHKTTVTSKRKMLRNFHAESSLFRIIVVNCICIALPFSTRVSCLPMEPFC